MPRDGARDKHSAVNKNLFHVNISEPKNFTLSTSFCGAPAMIYTKEIRIEQVAQPEEFLFG
jgi:hypothetical protein